MPICIECDFCGARLEEISLQDSWELQKHREAGRIACGDCEELFKEYEDALGQLEEKNRLDFEEAKRQLKEKYFGEKKDAEKDHEKKSSQKDNESGNIPRTYFRTRDS